MGVVSLKVVIAGRTYPLNVSEEEQGKVLKAAEDINKAFDLLRTNYAVKDPQDLLAMSALQLLARNQSSAKTEKTVTLPADYTSIENALAQLANDIEELN
jgi:cell division protein ZapA (FtsZ GTPase activity inhibitor)